VFYTDDPAELAQAQMIVLPGSKNTIDDLLFLRDRGLNEALLQAVAAGLIVIGICGGYQMMGLTVADPFGVEGEPRTVEGIGLLPVHSTLGKVKTTVRRTFHFGHETGPLCKGYEIHMGHTAGDERRPLNYPAEEGGVPDGYCRSAICWGTYMHGILDNPAVIIDLMNSAGIQLTGDIQASDYQSYKETQYDRLADHIRLHIDLPFIYRSLRGSKT
jgi:adenosylcobyric acid synthase